MVETIPGLKHLGTSCDGDTDYEHCHDGVTTPSKNEK